MLKRSVYKNSHAMKTQKYTHEEKVDLLKKSATATTPHLYRYIDAPNHILFDGIVVILITSGSLRITLSGRTYTAVAGSLLLIAPNTLCQIVSLSEEFKSRVAPISLEEIIDMPNPVDTDFINIARRSPQIVLPDDTTTSSVERYFDLVEECEQLTTHTYLHEMRQAFLYALVLEVSHLQRTTEGEGTNEAKVRPERLSDDFFLLLAEHYKQERSVAFYAEQMHLTPKYLSGQIKRITGKSILEWINETVITEIKVMLKTTDLTVWQISEALNFSNPSAFVQYFKHHTGTTPLKFRRS